MKKLIWLSIVFVCFLLGVGAYYFLQTDSDNNESEFSKSLPFNNGDGKVYAVFNLEYGSIEDRKNEIIEKYFHHLDKSKISSIKEIMIEGNEKYLIVPRYNDMEFEIYRLTLNDNGNLDEKYIQKVKGPFYLNCNLSDLYPNSLIKVTYGNKMYEYSPHMSLKDGTLFKEEFILYEAS